MKRWLLLACLFCLPWLNSFADNQPLMPEQAFIFSASLAPDNTIMLNWQIAPDHYLYQERFHFTILKPKHAVLGTVIYPRAEKRHDDVLGDYQVYFNQLNLGIPILDAGKSPITLQVTYQGCSATGYCYPPLTHKVTANFVQQTVKLDGKSFTEKLQQAAWLHTLSGKRVLVLFFSFVGFGLLLSFTPCVLPMIPILSGIIIGQGQHLTTGKAFRLSLTYVLSMSVTYAVAGMLIGYLGGSLQALMQIPWVIAGFSVVFIFMALSMFGLYDIQPPQKFEMFLARVSGHQKKGSYIGAAIMGCLGTLILSPCVTPALVTAMGYITQEGDTLLGGVTLFATGLGMGLPLLLLGPFHKLLPKAGHWMVRIKIFLGFTLLAMGILLLARIFSGTIIMLLWALWVGGIGIYLLTTAHWHKYLVRSLGVIVMLYSMILIVAANRGITDPLSPFSQQQNLNNLTFQSVKNLSDLSRALTVAKTEHKPVFLDFYADWCIACKEMERETFTDSNIQTTLKSFYLIRADVTANDGAAKALMKKYGVIAPPTMIFFNSEGDQIPAQRQIGSKSVDELLSVLKEVLRNSSGN